MAQMRIQTIILTENPPVCVHKPTQTAPTTAPSKAPNDNHFFRMLSYNYEYYLEERSITDIH